MRKLQTPTSTVIEILVFQIMSFANDLCTYIVLAILAIFAGKAGLNLYKTFLRPGKDLKKLGSWAVVTGATGK